MSNNNNFGQEIISINLDGRTSNLLKLEEIIRSNRPLVCLLQDIPKFNKNALVDTCKAIAKNYNTTFDENYLARCNKIDNLILTDKERVCIKTKHLNNTASKASSLGISICCYCVIHEDEEQNEEFEEDEEEGSTLDDRIRDVQGSYNNTTRMELGSLIIFSVYIRPKATYQDTKNCLDWILNTSKENEGHSRTIVMGDMNAIEATWCPVENMVSNKEKSEGHYNQIKEVRGRMIAKHFNKMRLTCLNQINQGPTFESATGNCSYIDLAFVGNKAIRTWKETKLAKIWEKPAHKAVILKAKCSTNTNRYKRRTYKRIKPELLTEDLFEEAHLQCNSLCINWKQLPRDRIIKRIDRITSVLYRVIHTAQNKVTTRVTRKLPMRDIGYTKGVLNARIRHQIKKLRRQEVKTNTLSRKIKRIKNKATTAINNNSDTYNTLKNNKRISKIKARKLRQTITNNMNINDLNDNYGNLAEQELWDRVHLMERNILNHNESNDNNSNIGIKSQTDINRLANLKFPMKIRTQLNYVQEAHNRTNESIRIEVNEEEIITAVRDLRNKSYTSPEGIKMNVFFNSLMFIPDIIKTLIEMSFWTCHIPKRAHITQGTLIPKKAAGQFRIVHVSSPLAALLELIALRRLEFRLEVSKLNSPYQFGFSALISRHDLVARVLEFFYKEYLKEGNKASGVIISLDIEGAFDNVNQDKLVQKMDIELGHDPIKYWLASFILSRKIKIKKGNWQSTPREICLGVPQGSALGPVLWNYMIHDIDKGIAEPGKVELIRYADDIILIYNGNNKNKAQITLNRLVNKLAEIDLNIRPEKCSVMGVRLGGRDQRDNAYYINGTRINNVDRTNVLGVPITNKLKLDRKSLEHRKKLEASIKKLHNINRIGLVNNAKEWRILIESYIKSRLIVNNWPVLILDHKSCKWIDDQMIKAIRIIFGWPINVSTRLIKLITGLLGCKDSVIRMAKLRATTEFKEIYLAMLKINANINEETIGRNNNNNNDERINENGINLETGIKRRRKHSNPLKPINIIEATNFQEIVEINSSTWILLDRNLGSMIAEVNENKEIIHFKLGRHAQYPISYFNSFALIWKIVIDRTCNTRLITLSESNSILSAIENPHNKDWRVIQLRERMFDNGWKIYKIRHNEDKRLRATLAERYKNISPQYDRNAFINDIRLWFNENETTTTENQTRTNMRPAHRVESLAEPYLLDYKRRNHINKWASIEDNSYYLGCHTNITRALASKPSVWQSITPNWIDGPKMLTLSGMTSNAARQLESGNREPSDNCHLCEQEINTEQERLHENRENWHDIDINIIKSNLVLHKTFTCKRLWPERLDFLKRAKIELSTERENHTTGEYLENILTNRRTCQKLLSFMVKCNS